MISHWFGCRPSCVWHPKFNPIPNWIYVNINLYIQYIILHYIYIMYNIYIYIYCYTHCRLRFQFHLSFMFGWICEPQWPPGSIQLDKKPMNSIEIHPPPAINLSTVISNVPCLNHYYIANGSITQLFHIKQNQTPQF